MPDGLLTALLGLYDTASERGHGGADMAAVRAAFDATTSEVHDVRHVSRRDHRHGCGRIQAWEARGPSGVTGNVRGLCLASTCSR